MTARLPDVLTDRAIAALKAVLSAEVRMCLDGNSCGSALLADKLRDWRTSDDHRSFSRSRRAVRALARLDGKSERQVWREMARDEE